jgi:hypothetical protein
VDGKHFDRLTTELATSTSRRSILGALTTGGLLGALGRRATSTMAQGDACTLNLSIAVRLGPSAGQFLSPGAAQPGVLSGRLRFTITSNGELDRGVLLLEDGTRLPVVGDASGRTLNLRITVNDGQTLVAVGIGQELIASCAGPIDGMLTGPQVGDLGDWHAVAEGGSSASTNDGEGETSGGQSGSSSGSSGTSEEPGTGSGQPTPTPASDPCPDGEVRCGNFCRDLLYDDFHCGRCDNPCPATTHYCEEGVCVEAVCPPGTANCMGYCADLSSSPVHCGFCGNSCGAGLTCCNGACTNLSNNPAQCGACGSGCFAQQTCVGGVCQDCTPSGGRCGTNTVCCAGSGCAPDTSPDQTMRCL